MNRGRGISVVRSGGFTIVETLIFLAVSTALFVSAMSLINGRQGKAHFENAVRNFESQLIDIANDVANGYYLSSNTAKCEVSAGAPLVTVPPLGLGARDVGTNGECIIVGRVIMPSDNTAEQISIYSLAGLRTTSSSPTFANYVTNDVRDLNEAKPRLIKPDTLITTQDIGYGTKVQCVKVYLTATSAPGCTTAAVGFLAKVRQGIEASGANKSGAGIQTGLYAYNNLASYDITDLEAGVISATNKYLDPAAGFLVHSVDICLKSGTTNQYALIKIGREGSSGLTIASEVKQAC